MNRNPGVLLASGGIDSSVLMFQLAREGELDSVFFCDYGQASAEKQWATVSGFASRLGVEAVRGKINWPDYARGKGFIFEAGKYPEDVDDPYDAVHMTPEEYAVYLEEKWDFIQGRNIVFLAYAGAWAVHRKVEVLYTAFQFDQPEWDAAGGDIYSDTSPNFVEAFNFVAENGGFSKPLSVSAPFLDNRTTKQQVVTLGLSLGVPLHETHSCEFFPACGGCHQCKIRSDVLRVKGRRFF